MKYSSEQNQIMESIKMIKKSKGKLTKQQIKTLCGQCLAGDVNGAIKGYYRLLRRMDEKRDPVTCNVT